MYDETKEDIKTIIELRTATSEAKAGMIMELIINHENAMRPSNIMNIAEPAQNIRKERKTINKGKSNTNWSDEDDELLLKHYLDEKEKTRKRKTLYAKLGKILNRSSTAIEVRLSKKGWKDLDKQIDSINKNIEPAKRKNKIKRHAVTQTEIDSVYKELNMGNTVPKIAKLLNVKPKRIYNIKDGMKTGKYKPSRNKKEEQVSVGDNTTMPKKFSYMN